MPPSEVAWNVLVQEASYHLRRIAQLARDEGKRGGPKEGWERLELERLRQFLRDAFGLEG